MSDTQAAMREFRFLDEKRKASGLSELEEQHWMELAGQLGVDISQQLGGYWGQDGQWYAYPQQGYDPNAYPQQGYDPNAYPQQQQGYDPNAYPQQQQQGYDPNAYPQQQQGYDPNAYPQQQQGYDPNAYPQQQQGYDPNAYPQQQQGYDPNAYPQQQQGYDPNAYPQQQGYDQNAQAYPQQGYGQPYPQQAWNQPAQPSAVPVPTAPAFPAPAASVEAVEGEAAEVGDDEVMEVSDEDVQLLDPSPPAEAPKPAPAAPSAPRFNKPIFAPERPLANKPLMPPAPVQPEARLAKADPVADLRSSLLDDVEPTQQPLPAAAPAPMAPAPLPPAPVAPAPTQHWENRVAVPVEIAQTAEPTQLEPTMQPVIEDIAERVASGPIAVPLEEDVPVTEADVEGTGAVEAQPPYEQPTQPAPSISVEPAPVFVPEPAPVSVPEPAPVFVPEPGPVFVPEPAPVFVPEPAPVFVAEPTPVFVPEPAPVFVPEPAPVFVPEPAPVFVAEPTPVFVPEPAPVFVPEPAPVFVPEPAPVFVPEPAPVFVPEPAPVFVPEPASVFAAQSSLPSVIVDDLPPLDIPAPRPSLPNIDITENLVEPPPPLPVAAVSKKRSLFEPEDLSIPAPVPSAPLIITEEPMMQARTPLPRPPPPPEPTPEPSIVVAEELVAPAFEPSVILADLPAAQPPPPPAPSEPSIVVSPELSRSPMPPPASEWASSAPTHPLPELAARPLDFDVEVDDAPLPIEANIDLSGSADDRPELGAPADFLPAAPVSTTALPEIELEATIVAEEEPHIQAESLATLANPGGPPPVPFDEDRTSPAEAPVPLASNADFLGQAELNNAGEPWQRTGPVALELDDAEAFTDTQITLPPKRVALGSDEDGEDDTDIVQGIVIEDGDAQEEEVTIRAERAVPSRDMFAAERGTPTPLQRVAAPPPPPAAPAFVPPPPPPRAFVPPPPPAAPAFAPAPPPPRAFVPPPTTAAPVFAKPPPAARPPEPAKKASPMVPGPPVAAPRGTESLDPDGDEQHIVVKGEHRVILHTLEGQVKRGAIRDADLSADHVALEGGAGAIAERIPRARVKAIFFMLPAGTKAPAADGQKVRVTFKDGRQVAGFSKDHKSGGPGFFVVPADNRTNTSRIFIFRHSVQAIAVD